MNLSRLGRRYTILIGIVMLIALVWWMIGE